MNAFNSALQRFGEVSVRLSVELGRAQLPLREVLALAEGNIVPLDRMTDELLDVTANGRVIARGEVVAQDGKFALRIVSMVDDGYPSGGAIDPLAVSPKPEPETVKPAAETPPPAEPPASSGDETGA